MVTLTKEELANFSKEDLINIVMKKQEENLLLQEQICVSKNLQFGNKSEKMEDLLSLPTFDEIENTASATEKEPELETVVYKRHKQVGKSEADLKDLPVTVVEHEMSEEELVETFGANNWKRLPDYVYKKVVLHRAYHEVLEHHVAVYASKVEDKIVRAKHPAELLPHSIATPSLVAGIMNAKYTNALPLYRIEQEYQRYDLHISRQTMANWVISCTNLYLYSMYEYLHKNLLTRSVLQADETPVIVSKDRTTKTGKSFMWVYRSGSFDDKNPVVLYEYQKSRATEYPEAFLKGFSGSLVCDGYSAYHKLGKTHSEITVANCYAHARRHFSKAVKAAGENPKMGKSLATEALQRIGAIYAEEEKIKDLSCEERLQVRQSAIQPLVVDFFAWIREHEHDVLSKSETGKGFTYCLNQEPYLKAFLSNGEIPIDNSASERAIRPFTTGRRNWVMIDSKNGAQSSAVIYSLVETAKANNLKPYEYLEWLLTEIPEHQNDTSTDYLENLLPWSDSVPEVCRKSQ